MRAIHYYFIGTGTWFISHGIQSVMFAWLVTMVLLETPEKVGLAQMVMLVPTTLLMLVGGSYADRFGGRRVAMIAQGFGVLPVLLLLYVVAADSLSFTTMLIYAVMMGCAQAFVTPARDGLLNQVAEGRIQRTVVLASLIQFGIQMVGLLAAGLADQIGPIAVLSGQAGALLVGVIAYRRIPRRVQAPQTTHAPMLPSIVDGCRTVLASTAMRPVVLQNIFMGIFFMGSYIVTIPLLIREVYDGSSADLAIVHAANALGLVTSIVGLLFLGDIKRQGRALLFTQGIGGVFLAAAGFGFGFPLMVGCIYLWGLCGGVAMSMSRTIMQEQAPDDQRGRVMAFFSFSFMGAGPIGAIGSGYVVEAMGAGPTLIVASVSMAFVVLVIGFTTSLWRLHHVSEPVAAPSDERAAAGP